jgi:glycerol uptake facilitator-like aquaporin
MGNYRFLNAWAEREQRRFEQQLANPRVPGTESTGQRFLQGFLATFVMATKCVILPLFVIWIVQLIARHTAQSLVLAVAVVMLFSLSVFTTGAVIRARREKGLNWFTGLAPKAARSVDRSS